MKMRIVFESATPKNNPKKDEKLIIVGGSKDQDSDSTKAEAPQTWNQSDHVRPNHDFIPGALDRIDTIANEYDGIQ